MEKSIEEIKELWKAETDEWVRIAVTENINDYPLEVQAIIRAEAVRRVSLRSNPEGASVTSENEPKPFKFKAKTQLKIGLVFACFILLNETYNLVNGQLIGASSADLFRYLIKIVTLSIYVTALVKRKIRVVQFVYSWWVWLMGFECALVFIFIVSPARRAATLANPIAALFGVAIVIMPYLMGIYVLKIGLCGLTKLIENQET